LPAHPTNAAACRRCEKRNVLPDNSNQNKKMEETLEDLLEWQKQERPDDKLVFMEVFTDGTACCQTGKDFEIHIEGDTPLEALKKTRAFLS
jgi:hypothetical protein